MWPLPRQAFWCCQPSDRTSCPPNVRSTSWASQKKSTLTVSHRANHVVLWKNKVGIYFCLPLPDWCVFGILNTSLTSLATNSAEAKAGAPTSSQLGKLIQSLLPERTNRWHVWHKEPQSLHQGKSAPERISHIFNHHFKYNIHIQLKKVWLYDYGQKWMHFNKLAFTWSNVLHIVLHLN